MLSYICGTTMDVRSSIIALDPRGQNTRVRRFRALWGESSGGDRERMLLWLGSFSPMLLSELILFWDQSFYIDTHQ
jgi:hypothetical protein